MLPPEIGQLRALTELDLTDCPLKELPPKIIRQLENLEKITLRDDLSP